ncbi:hypothetical protein SAMN02745146_1050 [Hymenobacter daecheongensis DSM 21074]|uniref:Uncharacterized protein n=1 Tax=Hymenobacter daecheongensis DSM 21074 TaxID=1121955 RepID=A0A1M6C7B1_9BACT|nr:hypothetical protein [Hymenobacter daecheongensis]SHI56674.1 hypothetical protein SAMN02745146_1050 [Hymenobacter daecheongensis DSM 21074]
MKKIVTFSFFALCLSLLLSLAPLATQAQCSMCKTQVESARSDKGEYDTSGLNSGILYLMTVPYILIGAVGYFWYRNTHAKK